MEKQNLLDNFFENVHRTNVYVNQENRNDFNQSPNSSKDNIDCACDCCVKCSPACDCTVCDCCVKCNIP